MDRKKIGFQQKLTQIYPIIPSYKLPTNITTDRHPIHRWFNFIAGFSPEFVSKCIIDANLGNDSLIIDPFAGCGTTLVEANVQGVRSIGFEAHLFLANICKSKLLIETNIEIIHAIKDDLLTIDPNEKILAEYSKASKKFLGKLIPENSLITLVTACKKVDSYTDKKYAMAYMILSKVLDLCSHAKTDGIYKAPSTKKKAHSYDEALETVCDSISEDLLFSQFNKIKNLAKIIFQSSEDMSIVKKQSCDLLVTSPPYLNNFDYAEMTRMYLYFWSHAGNWGEITEKVRSKLIVNTTTALKGHKNSIWKYRAQIPPCVHNELDYYFDALSEKRKVKAGKKRYNYIIYPYFYQMTHVLKNSHNVLKDGAAAHIIVADAALYGIHIRTQEILASIMDAVGFRDIEVIKLRSRGHRWVLDKREGTEDGLGEYQITGYAKHT
ncbi:MAG: DNA methyltransferase [Candidatus Methanofastidiosia archaeon]|jgi:DNA modification methylase